MPTEKLTLSYVLPQEVVQGFVTDAYEAVSNAVDGAVPVLMCINIQYSVAVFVVA